MVSVIMPKYYLIGYDAEAQMIKHFRVNVHVSRQLLGWMFLLGKTVKIIGPDEVVEEMRG